jgi:Xaa-Pro aminopeptidase
VTADGIRRIRMETAVRRDLLRVGRLDEGVRASLAQSALILAHAIDSYAKEAKSPAELSAITKAIQELRTVLGKLVEADDDGDDEAEFAARMSAPVRNPAVPGAEDTRRPDRGSGTAAG